MIFYFDFLVKIRLSNHRPKWMFDNWLSKEYTNRVNEFIIFASTKNYNDFIKYPCVRCYYINRIKATKIKYHLFMALIKGIHDGHGPVKSNYLIHLAIIKLKASNSQMTWVWMIKSGMWCSMGRNMLLVIRMTKT